MIDKEVRELNIKLLKLITEGRFGPAKLKSAIALLEKKGDEKTVSLVEGGAKGKTGDKVDGALEEAFRVMGLSDEEAKVAARGRRVD